MDEFELIVGLLLLSVIVAAAARRVNAPYPAFLALGGMLLAFVPGAPRIVLRPDLALALFVAPVLLDAAYDASPRDLKRNWRPLAALVIGAVGLTTVAVACVARALEPGLEWPVAVALGAIVAPPDAAAATSVLRQVRLPHRILTILEGESLLNDATALLIYRTAVGVVIVGGFSWSDLGPAFVLGIAGSVFVGPALAWVYLRATRRIQDAPSAIILQFIGTFGVWILAERAGLSAVLTTVCYAIAIARRAPEQTPAALRVPAYAVWETAVFVLNVLAFMLIGLQIRPVLDALEPAQRSRFFWVALAVLGTVIVVRLAWVMAYGAVARSFARSSARTATRPSSVREGLIVSWCGMRGIVTLAAALALPVSIDGSPFPFRDLVVLTAFSVVLGTLVVQGLTLKPLLDRMKLRDDDPVGREIELARGRALGAALASVEGERSAPAEAVRREYGVLLGRGVSDGGGPEDLQVHGELRRKALYSARSAVSQMRIDGEIGDEAFHALEEDLDRLELGTVPR